jgi:hypothetical protein
MAVKIPTMAQEGYSVEQRVWTHEDANRLRQCRLRLGLDEEAFGKRCALSMAQVMELEGRRTGCFYTDAIKYQAGQKLLKYHGIESPASTVYAPTFRGPTAAPDAPAPLPVAAQGIGPSSAPPGRSPRVGPVSPKVATAMGAVALAVIAVLWGWSSEPAPSQAPPPLPPPVSAVVSEPVSALPPVPQEGPAPAEAAVAPTPPQPTPESGADAEQMASLTEAVRRPSGASPETKRAPDSRSPDWRCPQVAPAGPVQRFTPTTTPPRGAHYVYVVGQAAGAVCVRDATGQVTLVRLSRGQGQSVLGEAPFTVYGPDMGRAQVYFQGLLVRQQPRIGQLQLVAH